MIFFFFLLFLAEVHLAADDPIAIQGRMNEVIGGLVAKNDEVVFDRKEAGQCVAPPLLAKRVNGLIFSGPSTQVIFSPRCPVSIQGVCIPDAKEFCEKMRGYLGCPLTLDLIEEIKEETLAFCRSRDLFLSKVALPDAQDVSSGVVHFIIVEGRVGTVSSIPPKWFSNEAILEDVQIEPGEVLRWDRVKQNLDWANKNPFHQTTLIFEPGQSEDEIDLIISTADRFPVRTYTSYENTGNLLAGNGRYLTGVEWGNAWGLGHRVHYLFLSAADLSHWWGQVLSYIAPLPWRHRLELFGSYVKAELSSRHGWGAQAVAKYQIPFWVGESKQMASIGYAFKRSNNVFDFGLTVMRMFDISEFLLSYEAGWDYLIGRTNLSLAWVLSPGNMTHFNKNANFSAIRTGAKSDYMYGRLEVDQSFFLPLKCSWFTNLIYQQATGFLLPSEEFSLGGYATVRGYEENDVISDNGVLIKNELRFPPLALPKLKDTCHELQVLAFCDLGWGYDVDQNILSRDTAFLGSAGPGVRYHFSNYASMRFDYGMQFNTIVRSVDNKRYHSHAHFGATVCF